MTREVAGDAVMPDFCSPRRGVRQDVDSALATLRDLSVPLERIRIERVGGGWKRGTVVQQAPAPGTAIRNTTRIELFVSAPAAVDALPYAMRHEHEDRFGVVGLMPVFDSPVAKLEAFIREAGGFLELRADDSRTAWRWIREIFAVHPDAWPADRLHALARLLPALHRVAGTAEGVHVALHTVFNLPVASVDVTKRLLRMRPELQTRLGVSNGRLGIDAVIGDGVTALAHVVVHIGPVSLDEYLQHDAPEMREFRETLYALVLPSAMLRPAEERWSVLPPARGCVIGGPSEAVRLGINSRLVPSAQGHNE
jgi:hypothetical protein